MKNTEIELKYITTPKHAIQHLNRSLEGKDLEALKVLAQQIDMMNHQDKEQHWLFAKLCIAVVCLVLDKKGNLFIALDKLRTYLQKPQDDLYIDLQGLIDDTRDSNAFESEGEIMDHLNPSKIESAKKPSLSKKVKDHEMEIDELKEIMIKIINTHLNDGKNYG